jgi:transposase
MVDHNDDPKPNIPRRVEVITGDERRRRWSEDVKARIVAETFVPGAMVTEIARRHDVRAQQIHGWRKDAREGRLVLPAVDGPAFAPVVIASVDRAPAQRRPPPAPPRAAQACIVEIEAKGVTVRVRGGGDIALIEALVRALRTRG